MQTTDYKRGYSKGYNTGRGEQSEIERQHQAEMLAVAQRAERAESAAGIGHCMDCAHWKRKSPTYAWGICTAGRQPGTPYGTWAQADTGGTNPATTSHFGCVLFLRKELK
jgi:hypothetical protein